MLERKTVSVNGMPVELEQRACACGCNAHFWVVPNSPQVYARKDCREKTAKQGGTGMSWLDVHRTRQENLKRLGLKPKAYA